MTALLDPRLSDCRRIFLQEFSLEASIGFHDFEKEARQRILVSVELFVPKQVSSSSRDDVQDVVDYDFIRMGVHRLTHSRHYNLQETLIDDIVRLCFEPQGVLAVRVTTQKPDVYPDCQTVGIEVFEWRPS